MFSNLHDVTVEREKVTEKEEIIYNKEVSRPETRKKPFLVIRWADQGDRLIGRDRGQAETGQGRTSQTYFHPQKRETVNLFLVSRFQASVNSKSEFWSLESTVTWKAVRLPGNRLVVLAVIRLIRQQIMWAELTY